MKKTQKKIQIIIGHRGWVHVGHIERETAREVVVSSARVIRRWGTTTGLAYLASAGPQESTVLDAPATMRIHPLAIIARYDCDPERWESHL